jgi:vancomycin resistance protein VanJ
MARTAAPARAAGRENGASVSRSRGRAARRHAARRGPSWPAGFSFLYLAGLCAVALFTRFVAEQAWWTTLLLYFPQVVYLVPLPFLMLPAYRRRDGRAFLACLAALVVVLGPMMGFNVPARALSLQEQAPVEGPRVRVLAYNIRSGTLGFEKIAAQVEAFRPDVVVFSEAIGWGREEELREELRERFPGWEHVQGGDVYIASRWPLVKRESMPLRPLDEGVESYRQRHKVRATFEAPFGRFHVVGVHFRTAIHGQTLLNQRHRVADYMRATGAIRREQARDVLSLVRELDGPVILAGDFNTPPSGLIYRRLTGPLEDAFARSGWGWGYTYPSRFPLLRIDYVFHSPHWETVEARVGEQPGSDHRPVFAELALRK